MRTTTKTIIFGGTHSVPEGWDLIIRCKLKIGDKMLRPWGEWERISKNMHGVNTNKDSWGWHLYYKT